MPIAPDYYPPFDPRELPADPSPRMETALQALYRASVEVHRTLYRLTVLHEITRNAAFVRRVNGTPLSYPMMTIRSGMTYAVAVSLPALFETDDGTASVRRVLGTLTDRREEDCIKRFHNETQTSTNVDAVLDRLRRLQRRLNKGDIGPIADRMADLRNKQLAHYDLNPELERGRLAPLDIDRAFGFAANVVATATAASVRRMLGVREAYEDARKQARDFTATLIRSAN